MLGIDLVAAISNPRAAGAAQCLVERVNEAVLFPLIALLSAIAFLVFLYGCFEYVRNADQSGAREEGQNHILYGIIGLLVMLSAYALLSVAAGTFGLDHEVRAARNAVCNPQQTGSVGPQ